MVLLWELWFDLQLLLFLPLTKVTSKQSVTISSSGTHSSQRAEHQPEATSKGTSHSPTVRSMLCLSPSARSRYKHPLW